MPRLRPRLLGRRRCCCRCLPTYSARWGRCSALRLLHRLLPLAALLLVGCSLSPSAGAPSPPALVEDPCHPAGVTYCALNPDVTPKTIRETICVVCWTATVRPS